MRRVETALLALLLVMILARTSVGADDSNYTPRSQTRRTGGNDDDGSTDARAPTRRIVRGKDDDNDADESDDNDPPRNVGQFKELPLPDITDETLNLDVDRSRVLQDVQCCDKVHDTTSYRRPNFFSLRTRGNFGVREAISNGVYVTPRMQSIFKQIQQKAAEKFGTADGQENNEDPQRQEKSRQGIPAPLRVTSAGEFDGLIEGDIRIRVTEMEEILESLEEERRRKRKIFSDSFSRWDVSNPITYKFKEEAYNSRQKIMIRQALEHLSSQTCIQFNEAANPSGDFIMFVKEKGCWSYVGRSGGEQSVSIDDGCFRLGTIVHEVSHALGFIHEQSRPERDDFVKIIKQNIMNLQQTNFLKYPGSETRNYGVPYDYTSVMHYSGTAFSKDPLDLNRITIKTIDPLMQTRIGQRVKLSFYDVKIMNLAYCNGRCSGGLTDDFCMNGGYRHPTDCNTCTCPTGLTGDKCEATVRVKETLEGGQILDIKTDESVILSSQLPAGRTSDIITSWLLRAPKGGTITIKMTDIDTAHYSDPRYGDPDWIEIRHKGLDQPGPRFSGFSVRNIPLLTSDTNEVLVVAETHFGYDASFTLKATVTCDACSDGTAATTTTSITASSDTCECSVWGSYSGCIPTNPFARKRCGCGEQSRTCEVTSGECSGTPTLTETVDCSPFRSCRTRNRGRYCCSGWTLKGRRCHKKN
ncbi:PREDICTED: blastula protease 10-like [Priapulus caudatus]|uniref:Metalloendopeptidase n=1 Tax=Priapulus caudatus TaxID=37621 RepID=A0ABM1E092_PRICU|nr:PREDICTED: blastula protease 10-like [Priapulus caudatus]